MPWVKLSDTFADDPRLEDAGAEALALHVAALCYCARQLTDGHISARAARRLWSVEDVDATTQRLVAAGLWRTDSDGGFEIVEYLVDQPDAATVRRQQEQKRARQRRWLDKRSTQDGSKDATQDGSKDAPPPRPAPKEAERGQRPSPGARCPRGHPRAADGSCCPHCQAETP